MNADTLYSKLVLDILNNGNLREPARTGMPETIGLFGTHLRFENIEENFPLLTTKKMGIKNIATEALWFLNGDTNIKYLVDNKCNIWNDDAYKYYKRLFPESNLTKEEFLEKVKLKETCDNKGEIYTFGDLGLVYGHNWRNFGGKKNGGFKKPEPNLREGLKRTYLGIANGSGSSTSPLGKTWEGMISRCYDQKNNQYHNYGAKGVYVCDRWLEFAVFEKDVKKLPNYQLKENSPKEYQLDKDGIGNGYCYSEKNCQWLSNSENVLTIFKKKYTLEKDGVKYTFENPTAFCKSQNISDKNISDLWTGNKNAKIRHGFTLVSVEDIEKNTGTDQIVKNLDSLLNDPFSRYHVVSAWNPSELGMCALPPCHILFQFYVRRNDDPKTKFTLDISFYMRSIDTGLGLPYNVASYAIILMIMAKKLGYKAGDVIFTGGDTHIYKDHIDNLKWQALRTPFKSPKLHISDEIIDLDFNEITTKHFLLLDYQSHPEVKLALSVGV